MSTFRETLFRTAVLVSVHHEQRDGLLPLLSFAGGAATCFNFTFSGEIHWGKKRLLALLAYA